MSENCSKFALKLEKCDNCLPFLQTKTLNYDAKNNFLVKKYCYISRILRENEGGGDVAFIFAYRASGKFQVKRDGRLAPALQSSWSAFAIS